MVFNCLLKKRIKALLKVTIDMVYDEKYSNSDIKLLKGFHSLPPK